MEFYYFKIEGEKVAIPPDNIKSYFFLGFCYFESGNKYRNELFVREDGVILDPLDTTILLSETMYDEEGEEITLSQDFFILDSFEGFELGNKIYLCDLLEAF